MIVETFAVGPLACNCTIVGDEATGNALVVDGGDGVDEVLLRLHALRLRATQLLHTHAHIDHIGDVGRLRAETGAAALLHPADIPLYEMLEWQAKLLGLAQAPAVVPLDGELNDDAFLECGDAALHVLHTPGHTPGSVCFSLGDGRESLVLSGDTLFAGSIGRWDLGGTSMQDIVESITRRLLVLPDETRVIPGHGPATTIGIERRTNPYLSTRTP